MRWRIPFSYGWATRAKTWLDKLSFFAIWFGPLLLLCGQFSKKNGRFLLQFALAAAAQYALYETGYLKNDFVTIQKERHPNDRLPPKMRLEVGAQYWKILRSRWSAAAICMGLLVGTGMKAAALMRFSLALGAMLLAFELHNTIRSRWNILTYLLLCSAKYAALPALFCPPETLGEALAVLFFCFPLPRSVEHASKEKYGLCFLREAPVWFRVRYYAVLSAVACIGTILSQIPLYAALLSLWFYGYRSGIAAAAEWLFPLRERAWR